MSVITEKDIFILFIGLLCAGALEFPCILIMHFLMPKAVLERYWKTPHFKPGEIALFTNTIYAPMRTIMLMSAIAFPGLGRKRDIAGAYLLAPKIYRLAAIVLCTWIIAVLVGTLIIIMGSSFYAYFNGERALWPMQNGGKFDWKQTAADLGLLFCVAFVLVKIFRKRGSCSP